MKNTVPYLSEILKMIDHGKNGNIEMLEKYALLMADKVEQDGFNEQAKLIRDHVNNVPGEMVIPQKYQSMKK